MTTDKFPWNHNNHYHPLLLKHVPHNCETALDIGCGAGEFASQLAQVSKNVQAIDTDQNAINQAHIYWSAHPNITWELSSFDEYQSAPESYDFISAIAVLHHMELAPTLDHMKRLLKPGGVLVILGLYKETTFSDFIYSVGSIPLNFVYQRSNNRTKSTANTNIVTAQAQESLKEIRDVMDVKLPRHTFKRHFLWRYSAIWKKPASL